MQYAESLIDKAVNSCGSAAELARKMGIDRAEVTKLRQGKRPLSPELAAELADIAGDDAREAAIHAIIDRNADGRKGHLLREILGKARAGGGAAVSDISYNEGSISAMEKIAKKADSGYPAIHRIYSMLQRVNRAPAACGAALARLVSLTAAHEMCELKKVRMAQRFTWGLSPHTPTPPLRHKAYVLGARLSLS